MKYISIAFRHVWGIWFYLNIAVWYFTLFPIFLVTLSFEKLYPVAHATRRLWGILVQTCTLQWWRVTYLKPVNLSKQHYIICSNHTSYLDIPMMCLSVPGYFNFMAKAELEKIPFFGRFFRTIDIPVNRKSLRDRYRAFELAKQHLASGASIVIFPEGGIPDGVPEMRKFKSGPIKIAMELGIPVLPVTFIDNWRLLPDDGKFTARPGFARAIVHAPMKITSTDDAALEEFASLLYDTIRGPLVVHGVLK